MILVITSKRDSHVGPVAGHFEQAGIPWVRLNTEDFATNVELIVTATGILYIRDSGKTIRLEEVGAVWYRKPDPVSIAHFTGLEPGALEYVEAEFGETLLGLYSLLNHVPWINNPFSTRIAHRKMLQLRTAANLGFNTPRTIITNRPEAALAFARALPGDVALKSLGAIVVTQAPSKDELIQYGLFTRRVSLAELQTVKETIRNQPTVFQEFLEKKYELRITCVGDQKFACRIESRADDLTADDYRFDTKRLQHTPQDCPELARRLDGYMRAFGLNFACFDILVTKNNTPVFLEANCNGQWYWIEQMTGLPIARAVAQYLIATQNKQPPQVTNCTGKKDFVDAARNEH